MGEIRLSRGGSRVVINLPKEGSGWEKAAQKIRLQNQKETEKEGALDGASSFFTNNAAFLVDYFGKLDDDGVGIHDLINYKDMVDRLRHARVSEMALRHLFSQLVENSPHSPALEDGRVIAGKFVDTVVSDAKRFAAESGAKNSATLSRKR